MSWTYPDSWSSLDFPWQREELLVFLEDAGKPDIWKSVDEVFFFIHFFFDDHDFTVGEQLLDQQEAHEMFRLLEIFGRVLGPGRTVQPLSSDLWQPFADKAAEVHALLSKKGRGIYVAD